MSARFEDALDVEFLDGRTWIVIQSFHYLTDVRIPASQRIEVPAGFQTDFASIPRGLWNILPPTGRYALAAVVHDYLYRTRYRATRAQADRVLLEAMGVLKVGRWTRWTIYSGVRLGGWASYKGGL